MVLLDLIQRTDNRYDGVEIDYQKRTGARETHTIGPEVIRMNEIRPGDLRLRHLLLRP